MYNIICQTNHQSRFEACYRMLGAGAWDNQQGWYEEGDGSGVQDGAHVYSTGTFMLMYGKTNTINIVKQLDPNKINIFILKKYCVQCEESKSVL